MRQKIAQPALRVMGVGRMVLGFIPQGLPVFQVFFGQGGVVANHHDIFGVTLFGVGGVVKAARLNGAAIDDDVFVVHDRMFPVHPDGDARINQFGHDGSGARIGLSLIHHDLNIHPPLLGFNQGIGNRVGGKGIGRHPNGFFSLCKVAGDQGGRFG